VCFQFNLSRLTIGIELIVTRVKRKSFLRDRTRSRPPAGPFSTRPIGKDPINKLERGPLRAQLPNYPQKKQNSSESVRRVLTSPSTGRRTIEGPKEGKGQTRLAFKHLSFPLTGRKVVTSVSVSAVQKRTRAKRTRGAVNLEIRLCLSTTRACPTPPT